MTKTPVLIILAATALGVGLLFSGCSSGSPPSQVQSVVRVSVKDVTGDPVAGAEVVITIGNQRFEGTETAAGEYEVPVMISPAGGQGELVVTPPDGGDVVQGSIDISTPATPPQFNVVINVPKPPPLPNI